MASSTVFRNIRIGVESTPGTAVTCPIALPALEITLAIAGGAGEVFRPAGQKHAAFVVPGGDEYTEITVGGKLCYNTLPYLLAGLDYAAPSTVTSGVYKWTCRPRTASADTYKTFTVQEGAGEATGGQMPWALFRSLGLDFKRAQIALSGAGFASKVTDGVSLTTVTKTVTPVPVLGDDIWVYLAASQAALGTATALSDMSNVEIHYNDKYGPWWGLNGSTDGYADTVERAPDLGGKIMVLNNATGRGYRTAMRAGDVKWLRIKAVGPIITGTYSYGLQIDAPIQFTNPGDREDDDGAYALGFNFACKDDSAIDGVNQGAILVVVTNSLATLT